ncbi:MAG: MATE family efflux transporter [Treponemataceae bacterium]|nr:MATE family efflux transporter [Treponemataceae bacterium]
MPSSKKRYSLGTDRVPYLLFKFAFPSIIAMLVGSIYNIIDQLFIGHKIGELGNAATNITFPFSTLCVSVALLFGIGGASCFNIEMGRGNKDKAAYYIGNSFVMQIIVGIFLLVVTQIILKPLLILFGSTPEVLPHAMTYSRVIAFGFPFLILTTAGGHLMRADGSPRMTMISSISGALINTVLDALFILVFEWGMFGAALATIIGQIFSGTLVIIYMTRYKTVHIGKDQLILRSKTVLKICKIGLASFFNQTAYLLVQIVVNNSLKHYGALSIYGANIPIALCGIASKVNLILHSICVGIAQGSQPIVSFNYGANQYSRVKKSYYLAITAGFAVSLLAFLLFQLIPDKIIMCFGKSNSQGYIELGVRIFRIFLFGSIVNFLQPITTTFFTSIGKPLKGIFLSMTRQVIFFIPLLLIFPLFWGIDGILYAAAVSDGIAAICAIIMITIEFTKVLNEKK